MINDDGNYTDAHYTDSGWIISVGIATVGMGRDCRYKLSVIFPAS